MDLKNACEMLVVFSQQISDLQKRKRVALEGEDFDTCRQISIDADSLRIEVESVFFVVGSQGQTLVVPTGDHAVDFGGVVRQRGDYQESEKAQNRNGFFQIIQCFLLLGVAMFRWLIGPSPSVQL